MRIGSEDLNFFKKENEGNSVFFSRYLKSLGECKRFIAFAILVLTFLSYYLILRIFFYRFATRKKEKTITRNETSNDEIKSSIIIIKRGKKYMNFYHKLI